MLTIYQTTANDEIALVPQVEKGCWINLINPTEEEINYISQQTQIATEFLKYPLDDEEIPRVEVEEEQIMIIINVPVERDAEVNYDTIPLGIVLNDDYIVTVCLEDVKLENDFVKTRVKGMTTYKKTRFILQLFQKKTNLYLKYLREINRHTEEIERELHKSMRNQELSHLLNIQKSLVYFITSLRSNEKVMQRLLRGKALKLYEEDEDLLEDVLIENHQAIEMADIYSNISTGTMNAFASIISNNLNIVMKLLAGITIVMSIPTMIASFFGMNLQGIPFAMHPWGFAIISTVSVIACIISIIILMKKDML